MIGSVSSMDYLPRMVDLELDELLPLAPAIAIDFPKGVEKTNTARRRVTTSWLLDDEDQRRIAAADFGVTSVPPGSLLLDEVRGLQSTPCPSPPSA